MPSTGKAVDIRFPWTAGIRKTQRESYLSLAIAAGRASSLSVRVPMLASTVNSFVSWETVVMFSRFEPIKMSMSWLVPIALARCVGGVD